jgi:hypothetical protein
MTTEPAYEEGDPRRLLSNASELARRVRKAQRATWFPLLVLAAVTFASIPVVRYGGFHSLDCTPVPGGKVCAIYSNARFVYWPIALVLAYAVISAFYIRRSRALGIGTRVLPYAIAGIIVGVALTGASIWEAHHPLVTVSLSTLLARLVSPACAIGLALLVLAWAERNRALLLLTIGYLVVVLGPAIAGWVANGHALGPSLPATAIYGGILLLGSIGFALAQRPLRATAP